MKSILIIGGSGFIGKNIVEALVGVECNIVLITRQLGFDQFKKNSTIKVIKGNLNDTHLIKSIILDYGIEVILHLASNLIPSSVKSQFDEEMKDIVLPTFEILNYISHKNIKIIYFSSGGTIYGKVGGKAFEGSELEPINYYGYSKLIIENHIKLLSRIADLRYVILRPSNVYGKYQRLESKQGFIAVAIGKILSNQSVEIWGDGNTTRDYVDVLDVAEAVKGIIQENIEDQIFNLGSGEGYSLLEVIASIEKHLQRSANVIFKRKREVDLDKMTLDISKLQSYIKYKPIRLNEGIKNFITYLEQVKSDDQ